ncbi:sugar ABC transporter substrate-binding protein [Spirochaetia bacterium]|nr:sugar ABC transporter substrate-binding protein [Spirochaetia bacterium]
MKKVLKVTVAILVAGLMVFSIAACKKSESAVSGDGSGELKGELKFAFWDSNQEIGLVTQAAAFMKMHPNLKITVETTPWAEYWTKMQAAASSGNLPDVFIMHPEQVKMYARGKTLMDLTPILDQLDLTKYPDYIVKDFYIDGKQWATPKDVGTMGFYYNKDIFDAAGYPYPTNDWTWDDLKKAAAALTNKSKGIYGICAPNNGQNYYWNIVWANGADYFAPDGTCIMDTPEHIEAMEFAISFIKDGYSPTVQDFTTMTQEEYFQSGRAAMIYNGGWMLNQYLAIDGLNFDCIETPKGKQRGAIASGMGYSISAATKNANAARAFVVWLGTREAQLIQAETGICVPVYEGTAQPWVEHFPQVDASPFVKAIQYGHLTVGFNTTTEESVIVNEIMPEIFDFQISVADGMKEITRRINAMGTERSK